MLTLAMVVTTVFSGAGSTAMAAESDSFIEVQVPNGDFEDTDMENNAWTFTGDVQGTDYYWKLFQNAYMTENLTTLYEVCSKKNTSVTKTYTCSQTVQGLVPGTYKASIEATGGNDPGTHTTTLTAKGVSVNVTPTQWNVWNTYTTDTFEVGEDGTCEIVINSTVTGQYLDMDNVKLWRMDDGTGKVVDKVQDITRKVKVGDSFTAPEKTVVLYTDGTSGVFDVVWNEKELAAVNTAQAAVYTVNGTVTVLEEDYPAVMTVEVVDGSSMIQDIPEDAEGAVDFDENWQFYLATRTPEVNGSFATGGVKDAGDYTTEEIIDPEFNDMDWRTVDVPHDFSIEGEKTSKSVDSQAYLQGGLAYYRKTFTMPESMQGKKTISVDFEGVYQNCVVYLNGQEVGSYPNGYTGFALDLTDKLNYGGENVLVVKVQNMSPSGRWYTGSGITRPVHMVVDNLAHFTRNGITLSAPTLEDDYTNDKSALLEVEANGYSDATNSNARLEVTVYDAEGKVVAEGQTENTAINPSTAFKLELKERNALEISDVNLWNPWNLGEPYLYTVKAELWTEVNGSADGYQLTDTEEMEYGFRWVEVKESTSDPESGGLYVNGMYTKVKGVDLHHDSGALGAASYTDAYERQFDKLMAMGVNAYRTSHCPPSKQAIEVCRRKGILVVEEAYDGWGNAKATYDFGNFFFQEIPEGWAGLKPNGYLNVPASVTAYEGAKYTWSDWVIQEMVNRDKNEPSIIAWSIGNEVRGVGRKPDWYQTSQYDVLGVNPGNMNEYTEAVRLLRDVDAADGTRYVLMGGDQERSVPSSTGMWGLVNQVLDGYGLNYNTAKSVDGLMNRFSIGDGTLLEKGTKTFFFESESSSQTSSRGVYLDPQFTNTGINQTPGSRGGSNYDNDFASWTMSNEYGLKKDRDRKSFIGQFIWTGFDYLGEPTPYSVYPVGVASFGTIDTAGFPKDSFYLYQSQWVDEPMVHLLPQNWDEWEEGEEVEVWVNTNVQTAELFLNGESLGKKSFDEKETAFGETYYETSEKTVDDKTWGDSSNPGGYTSTGAVLDEGELNSGKLHLTWTVPYEPGTLEVKAYDSTGSVVAQDSVTTSETAYTIQAEADKTVLAADGSSLSYVECTIVDEKGNMVPDAANLVNFDVDGAATIAGVDNGQQESTELYKYGNTDHSSHSERKAYNGKVLVILKSGKEAGTATLNISSEDLKPVRVNFQVTEDGTGEAPVQTEVTGTAVSAEPVEITVPEGLKPVLPSAVRVHYTSDAGEFTLMRPVTWGTLTEGKAEGTIEGLTVKAEAEITEDPSLEYGAELATNTELGSGNDTFEFKELDADSTAASMALATASFTGSTSSYPNNMLDGNEDTSWTNAYNRGASVLLPSNNLSRRSEYVEFYWKDAKLMNQVSLNFVESRYCAVPETLTVEYWNGMDWQKADSQVTVKMADAPTVMQFTPVFTDRIRVYMVNATPFTASGNIEITEASVKLADPADMGTQIILEAQETTVTQGESIEVSADFGYIPSNVTIQSIQFTADYDTAVFEQPAVALAEGVDGSLTSEEKDGTLVYTYVNENGITDTWKKFLTITMTAKAEAQTGESSLTLGSLKGMAPGGEEVSLQAGSISLTVEMRPIIGEVTYLSDLEWKEAASGWDEVRKDTNCNGSNSSRIALKVNGQKTAFEKGLGACADSEILYDLTNITESMKEKETLYFQSYVGVDYFKTEEGENGDGMYFIVYGDGEELYRSGLMDSDSEAEHISLNITGVKELKLVMDKNILNAHDNGDWADAKLIVVPDPDAVVKTGLKEAIQKAEGMKAEDYTAASYLALQDAIAEAKAVYEKEDATQDEVDGQITKLQEAIDGLKIPDVSDYQELLNQLRQSEQELENAKALVSQLQKQLEGVSGDKTELEKQLKQAKDRLEILENENTRLKAALKAAQELAQQEKQNAEQAKKEAEEAARKQAEAEKAKKEALDALKKIQEEMEAMKAELDQLKAQKNLKKGDTVSVNGVKYRVTNAAGKQAEAYGAVSEKARRILVADTVKIKGVECRVTGIGKNAFRGMKKLSKAVIGKNVRVVGARAFYGDKRLKNITVKAKGLKTVKKQALKGISARAVIKVPKNKKKTYTSIFKGKGQKKTVKVK